jgi:hypothetical protein
MATTTLAMLRRAVKINVFIGELNLDNALWKAVVDVPAEQLGNLILEAEGKVHPSLVFGSSSVAYSTFEETLREALKSVLKAQLVLEAWYES